MLKSCENHKINISLVMYKIIAFIFTGNITGVQLLDIASGPTVRSVISASKWFSKITLSDFSETNLTELQKWLKGDSEALDSGPMFSFVSSLDPQG